MEMIGGALIMLAGVMFGAALAFAAINRDKENK